MGHVPSSLFLLVLVKFVQEFIETIRQKKNVAVVLSMQSILIEFVLVIPEIDLAAAFCFDADCNDVAERICCNGQEVAWDAFAIYVAHTIEIVDVPWTNAQKSLHSGRFMRPAWYIERIGFGCASVELKQESLVFNGKQNAMASFEPRNLFFRCRWECSFKFHAHGGHACCKSAFSTVCRGETVDRRYARSAQT